MLTRHLLPAARGFIVVEITMLVPAFIIAEATLSYVGLGQVREFVMGNDDRAPTADELAKMTGVVADAMKQGAYGVACIRSILGAPNPAAASSGPAAKLLRR